MIDTEPTNLNFALNYAREHGWAVFPLHTVDGSGQCTCGSHGCKSSGKHPRTANGVLDATTDSDQIDVWFSQWPDANIGIATGDVSGICVLDIDAAKGAVPSDLIFDDLDVTVFTTPKVQTGAGFHYYYKMPAGVDLRNSTSKLAKYIDVRANGGYVVAPPSKHVSGKHYQFLNPDTEIADFPAEWITRLLQPTVSSPSGNGNANGSTANGNSPFIVPPPDPGFIVPQLVDLGSRNNTLISLAGLMRHHGFGEDAIYSALRSENQRVCKPPLDDKEVHQIAHSAGRYAPKNVIAAVTDDDKNPDYENTLTPYLYRDFRKAQFEAKEILSFHIGKRDIAIIQAATNAGKTSLLRNVSLCMAAGREFMPFFEGQRAIKLAYFDFENDAQDVQRDLALMDTIFSPSELAKIEENLIVMPKGLMGGELFQFNTHEKWANELIFDNHVEFIVVDNISAAYDLNDENSNAEVTKKVIKPLLKMAYKGDCAFLFAHHYGKGKASEIEHAGVHAGRGASALQALSRTVINMFGDVSKGEPVTVECAKRKTDGGQNYREVFELKPDRWFHHTTIVAPPKKHTAYQAIRDYLKTVSHTNAVTMADLITKFENDYGPDSIKKAAAELVKDGFAEKAGHGKYYGKDDTSKPRNYYDKDDD